MADRLACILLLLGLLGPAGCRSAGPPLASTVPVRALVTDGLWELDALPVAVLPFEGDGILPGSCTAARRELMLALRDVAGCEVTPVDADLLGRSHDSARLDPAALPLDLLIRLHRDFGATGALFGTVTFARPYGEPALGMDLVLLDTRTGNLLWRAADVVDARNPATRAALLEFQRLEQPAPLVRERADASQVPLEIFTRFVARSFALSMLPPPPVEVPPESALVAGEEEDGPSGS